MSNKELSNDIEKKLVHLAHICSVHDYLSEEGNKCLNETIQELEALIRARELQARINTKKEIRAWAFNLGDKLLAELLHEQVKELEQLKTLKNKEEL